MAKGKDMGMMLCDGEVDALISPQPRQSMLARPDRYRRLFPDAHARGDRAITTSTASIRSCT